MTVDWSTWLTDTEAQQEAKRAEYRRIIKNESDAARASNYRRMDEAIRRVVRG